MTIFISQVSIKCSPTKILLFYTDVICSGNSEVYIFPICYLLAWTIMSIYIWH